jgi:LDH2 family malate/lactate/ureidoglycolate dehydrogenase
MDSLMSQDFITIRSQPLTDFAQALLEACNVPPSTAHMVAESLVASNLRGVDSHGVHLLLWYTEQLRIGNISLHSRGHVASENGACMIYDGENGIGALVSGICCDHAIRIANSEGIGMVTARNSTHFGACAWWAQKIAAAGQIGIVMCNATPLVAPWQSREKMLGTNPICMAVPGPNTFLLDMATTTVALNRIYKSLLSGDKSIPAGWAMDADGNPTTDPKTASEGLPMPLGGYKGSGLAVMVEILCAVLSGGAMLTQVGGMRETGKPMSVSHMFLAIDVDRFMPVDEFAKRMEWVREAVTHSQPASGFDEVMIAGDPEWRTVETRSRDGVPVSAGIWHELMTLARTLNVPEPATAA